MPALKFAVCVKIYLQIFKISVKIYLYLPGMR